MLTERVVCKDPILNPMPLNTILVPDQMGELFGVAVGHLFKPEPQCTARSVQEPVSFQASLVDSWFFGGVITYLLVLVLRDWYEIYLTHIELAHPRSRAGKTMKRNKWASFLDQITHIIMLVAILVATGVAMFYMAGVGAMVVNAFAILFIEELDDYARSWVLQQFRKLPSDVAGVVHICC